MEVRRALPVGLHENVCLWKYSSFLPNSVGPDTKLMLAPNVGSGMMLEGEDNDADYLILPSAFRTLSGVNG